MMIDYTQARAGVGGRKLYPFTDYNSRTQTTPANSNPATTLIYSSVSENLTMLQSGTWMMNVPWS